LLQQQEGTVEKILLRGCDCLAFRQHPRIEADQSLAPASQIDQSIINAGAAPCKMHQLTLLKIEMKRSYSHCIAQRQTAISPCGANSSDHRS
jgi:hypothetical protein